MPIKGLSDQLTLPRLGKIKLGIMKENAIGKKYPSETEHSVVPDEVAAIYGDKPTALDVMFPVDDEGMVFGQWLKWYGSDQGLKCRGDGELAMRRYDLVDDESRQAQIGATYFDECFYIQAVAERNFFSDREIEPENAFFLSIVFKHLGGVSSTSTDLGALQ